MMIDTSDFTAFVQSVQGNPDIFLDWYHKLDAFAGSQISHTENVTQQLHHYKSQYELLQSEYNSTSKNFEKTTYVTEELRSQLTVKKTVSHQSPNRRCSGKSPYNYAYSD